MRLHLFIDIVTVILMATFIISSIHSLTVGIVNRSFVLLTASDDGKDAASDDDDDVK